MTYLFFLGIFTLIFLSLRNYSDTKPNAILLECMLSPAVFAIILILPALILSPFSLLKPIPYKIGLTATLTILVLLRKATILGNVVALKQSGLKLSKDKTSILVILFLAILGIILRTYSKEVFDGDGLRVWAFRGMEWANLGEIGYTETTSFYLKTWINYPLFPSLLSTSSILIWDNIPQLYAANIFDCLPIIGLLFSTCFFVSLFHKNITKALIIGACIAYFPRMFHSMAGSSYADLWVVYLFTALFSLLWSLKLDEGIISYWKIVLISALLAVSKSEGLFRAYLLLIPFICFRFKNKKELLLLIAPASAYFFLKSLNPTTIQYQHYLSEISLDPRNLIDRFPIVFESLYLSFLGTEKSVLKADWPVLVMGGSFSLCMNLKKHTTEVLLLLLLIVLNIGFNIAPFWIAPIPGVIFNDPKLISEGILIRLNSQVYFLFMVLIFLRSFKDEKLRLPEQN